MLRGEKKKKEKRIEGWNDVVRGRDWCSDGDGGIQNGVSKTLGSASSAENAPAASKTTGVASSQGTEYPDSFSSRQGAPRQAQWGLREVVGWVCLEGEGRGEWVSVRACSCVYLSASVKWQDGWLILPYQMCLASISCELFSTREGWNVGEEIILVAVHAAQSRLVQSLTIFKTIFVIGKKFTNLFIEKILFYPWKDAIINFFCLKIFQWKTNR